MLVFLFFRIVPFFFTWIIYLIIIFIIYDFTFSTLSLIKNLVYFTIFLTIYLLFFFVAIFFEKYDFTDINFRFDVNDSIPNFYSFFWTNIWYLAVFFWFMFFFFFFFSSFRLYKIFCLLIFYTYEVTDFWSSNFSFQFFNFYAVNMNFLLTNDLNKYHPLIFYTSVWFFLLATSVFVCLTKSLLFKDSLLIFKIEFFQKLFYLLSYVSLYLGSWWAIQEGTWGGWWNWDASEVFGLILLLFSIAQFHSKMHVFFFQKKKFFFLSFFISFIFFYALIQLNFDLISHNFGIKFFFFFNNTLFLLELLFLTCIFLWKSFLKYIIQILNFKFVTKPIFIYIFNKLSLSIAIFLLIFLILGHSFSPLMHYFFWNFFEINIINDVDYFSMKKISFFIFILVFFFLLRVSYSNFFIFNYFFCNYFFVLINFIYFKFNLFFFIHLLFLLFVFINILSLNTQFLMFFFKDQSLEWFTYNFFCMLTGVVVILDAFILQCSSLIKFLSLFIENSVNIKFLPFSFITSNFFFMQTSLTFNNTLIVFSLNNFFLTFIEVQYLQFQFFLFFGQFFFLFFLQKTDFFFN